MATNILTDAHSGDAIVTFSETVILNNSDIVNLPTTSIEIIPSQGPNKIIIPVNIVFVTNWVQPYAVLAQDDHLFIRYNSINTHLVDIPNTDTDSMLNAFLTNSTVWPNTLPYYAVWSSYWAGIVTNSGIVATNEDKAVEIGISSASGNLTFGDAANTFKILFYYLVIDIS